MAEAIILASGEAIAARRRFRVLRKLLHHRSFMVGFVIVLAMVLAAVLAPLTGVDPNAMRIRFRFRPPQEAYLFGTDQFGRDLFTRTRRIRREIIDSGQAGPPQAKPGD